MPLLIVAAVIFILLMLPVTVELGVDKEVALSVRYLFFKLSILPAKGKEQKKKAKKIKEAALPKKRTIEELRSALDWGNLRFNRLFGAVKKFVRRTTVADLRLSITVSGRDAAAIAMAYGRTNAVVYSAIAVLDRMVKLRVGQIDIIPGFDGREAGAAVSCKVKILPLAMIAAALNIGLWLLVSIVKGRSKPKNRPERKEKEDGKQTPDRRDTKCLT